MAGIGERFKKYNFKVIKPLILVDKECILEKSIKNLPNAEKKYILHNKKILEKSTILKKIILNNNINSVPLEKKTEGQADTVNKLKHVIDGKENALIHSCDYILVFNLDKFFSLSKKSDIIIFVSKLENKIIQDYNAFAYCKTNKKKNVTKIVEKKTLSKSPWKDHVVTGSFWFKEISVFFRSHEISQKKNKKINNEYYIANNINNLIAGFGKKNLKIKILEVENWINLGDYYSLKEYIYWQDFFRNNIDIKKC